MAWIPDYICACCQRAFDGLCGVNDAGVPYCSEKCFESRPTPQETDMTDTQAPERIWAEDFKPTSHGKLHVVAGNYILNSRSTEYTRTDIHTAALAQRDVCLSEMRRDRDKCKSDARQWKADCRSAQADAIARDAVIARLVEAGTFAREQLLRAGADGWASGLDAALAEAKTIPG